MFNIIKSQKLKLLFFILAINVNNFSFTMDFSGEFNFGSQYSDDGEKPFDFGETPFKFGDTPGQDPINNDGGGDTSFNFLPNVNPGEIVFKKNEKVASVVTSKSLPQLQLPPRDKETAVFLEKIEQEKKDERHWEEEAKKSKARILNCTKFRSNIPENDGKIIETSEAKKEENLEYCKRFKHTGISLNRPWPSASHPIGFYYDRGEKSEVSGNGAYLVVCKGNIVGRYPLDRKECGVLYKHEFDYSNNGEEVEVDEKDYAFERLRNIRSVIAARGSIDNREDLIEYEKRYSKKAKSIKKLIISFSGKRFGSIDDCGGFTIYIKGKTPEESESIKLNSQLESILEIYNVVITKDDRYAVISCRSGSMRLPHLQKYVLLVYDIEKKEEVARYKDPDSITNITSDNSHVIKIDNEKEVVAFGIKSKEEKFLYEQSSEIYFLETVADKIASCTEDGEIVVYDLKEKDILLKISVFLDDDYDQIKKFSFSKSGRYLMIVTCFGKVFVLDLHKKLNPLYEKNNFKQLVIFEKECNIHEEIKSFYLDEDREIFLFGTTDYFVYVCDLKNSSITELKRKGDDNLGAINHLILTEDGKVIISSTARKGYISVFDIESRKELYKLEFDSGFKKLFINRDQSKIILESSSGEKDKVFSTITLSSEVYYSNAKERVLKKLKEKLKEKWLLKALRKKNRMSDLLIKCRA